MAKHLNYAISYNIVADVIQCNEAIIYNILRGKTTIPP